MSDEPGVWEWELPAGSLPLARPGRYMWQAVDGRDNTLRPATALRAFHVMIPASWQVRGPLGPRRKRGSLQVSTHTPRGLSASRFRWMASQSARRWGIGIDGATNRVAGVADRVNVIGFGTAVPGNALGVQRDLVERRVLISPTGERTVTSSRVVDRDITIRPDMGWWIGPGALPADRLDLETVLIHELGHFAGNPRHLRHCTNSPMATGLAPGEWWHTARDHFAFCDAAPVARAASVRRLHLVHRTEYVDVTQG
jgi:hypothetical protein